MDPAEQPSHTAPAPDTDALLRDAVAGDVDAFEQLIAPLHRPVYGYALRLCGDPHEAEDLAQEAFIKAYRGISSFSGNATLSTWMYRIVRNTWIDDLKRRGRQPLDLVIRERSTDDDRNMESPGMDREAVQRFFEQTRGQAAHEKVSAALALMPDFLREAIVLRDIESRSYDEVAYVIGIPVGTVKSRLTRARARLKKLLCEADTEATTSGKTDPFPPT